MLDNFRVNGNTIKCLKRNENNLKFSLYDFESNLSKALELPHVRKQKLHGLTLMVQLNMKMVLGIALEVPEPVPNIDTNAQAKGKGVKYTKIILEVRVKKIMSQCPKKNVSRVVK